MLAAVDAEQPVVRRHDRPWARAAHGGLEGREVDLAQRALVDLGLGVGGGVGLELGVGLGSGFGQGLGL